MTNEPNEKDQDIPLPSSEAIDEALGKVANGQVPDRRVANRRQLTDRRQPVVDPPTEEVENAPTDKEGQS